MSRQNTFQKQLVREEWWLMTCDFPNLNWARLRIYDDGTADVFDSDGTTMLFVSYDKAWENLSEDEYDTIDAVRKDAVEYGLSLEELTPPTANADVDLIARMLKRKI
jgi:hypothetical protein